MPVEKRRCINYMQLYLSRSNNTYFERRKDQFGIFLSNCKLAKFVAMVDRHGARDVTQPMSAADATPAPQDGRRRSIAAASSV